LKPSPIALAGSVTDDNWLAIAAPLIQQRIEKYSASEIRFNLMALVKNREEALQSQIAALETRRILLEGKQGGMTRLTMIVFLASPSSLSFILDAMVVDGAADELHTVQAQLTQVHDALADERHKRETWKVRHHRLTVVYQL